MCLCVYVCVFVYSFSWFLFCELLLIFSALFSIKFYTFLKFVEVLHTSWTLNLYMLHIASRSLWIVFFIIILLLLNGSFNFHVLQFLIFFKWWFALPTLSLSYGYKAILLYFLLKGNTYLLLYGVRKVFNFTFSILVTNCLGTIYWLVHPFSLIVDKTISVKFIHVCVLGYPFCSIGLYQSPNQ